MTDETATCEDCHRPLKDAASVARGRGPVCQRKYADDTRIGPPPRPKRSCEDVPFPGFPTPERTPAVAERTELEHLVEVVADAAPNVAEEDRRLILLAVLQQLDDLIDDAAEDSSWPEPGDLALLARQLL